MYPFEDVPMPTDREARTTLEPIRLKYVNLGDFGGTDPITDSWLLEVKGPYEAMQELMPTLKKYKFRWDPRSKSWSIHATHYAYNNRKRENFWRAARRNQKAAYPVLKDMVDAYNKKVREHDQGVSGGPQTPKEFIQWASRQQRQMIRLTGAGINVQFEIPNRFSVDEMKA